MATCGCAQYRFQVCSSQQHELTSFEPGDEVLVFQSKGKSGGRARQEGFAKGIVESPGLVEDATSRFMGRVRVRYSGDGSVYHVRPERLELVPQLRNTVLVCRETWEYRRLARLITGPQDSVLEIGCDFGLTTTILAECLGQGKLIAVDKSEEHVLMARKALPQVQIEVLDVLQDPAALARLGGGVGKVFFDINGNRELEAVMQLLHEIQQHLAPDTIVVKSQALTSRLVAPGSGGTLQGCMWTVPLRT